MCVSPAPRWWHCTPGEQGGHGELGARSLFPTFSLTKASCLQGQVRSRSLQWRRWGLNPRVSLMRGNAPRFILVIQVGVCAVGSAGARRGFWSPGTAQSVPPHGVDAEKGQSSWALSPTPAPTTRLSCLGLVAANGFHLLRPPAPDTTFVPETDQRRAHEDSHPLNSGQSRPFQRPPPISLPAGKHTRTLKRLPGQLGQMNRGLRTRKYWGIVHFC